MDNELYHYGIPGMKWGIRRYQNEDGTYTTAGKKRLAQQSKSSEELQKEITERKTKATEAGQVSAALALMGIGGLGLNALTATTLGVISPQTIAASVVSVGFGAYEGAIAAIESVKVSSLKAQLKQIEADKIAGRD